jgi:glucan biosynthesis protein C
MQPAPPPSAQRYHHLDAARALFMLLGIPFHASLAFAGGHWLVMSGTRDPLLAIIPPLLSDFRMPGFFLIAGFFAAMLLERRSRREWLKGRVERLGVPLLTGMAIILPLQAAMLWYAPREMVDPAAAAHPLAHLWFLPTLLVLCVLLAAVWPLVTRARASAAPPVIALAAGLAVYELGLVVAEHLLHSDLSFVGGYVDLGTMAIFLPFFALGVALRRSPALWNRFARFDPAVAIIGAIALVLHIGLWEDRSTIGMALDILFDGLSSVCLVQTILALLLRLFSKPSARIDRMVDASFTIYLLHHPVVVGLAILSLTAAVPPLLAWVAICIAAFVLPYAAHRLLRHSPLALWLLNGVRPQQRGWGLLVGAREGAPA